MLRYQKKNNAHLIISTKLFVGRDAINKMVYRSIENKMVLRSVRK